MFAIVKLLIAVEGVALLNTAVLTELVIALVIIAEYVVNERSTQIGIKRSLRRIYWSSALWSATHQYSEKC